MLLKVQIFGNFLSTVIAKLYF